MLKEAECIDVYYASDGIPRDVSGKTRHEDPGIIPDAGDTSWRNDRIIYIYLSKGIASGR